MDIINRTKNATSKVINPFFSFLKKFNIVPLAFSLIISLNLNQLSNSFIETIISPIINKLFNFNLYEFQKEMRMLRAKAGLL